MDISRFLAKVIGLNLVISGLWLVVRRSDLDGLIQDFTQSPALVAFSGRVALLIGTLLVVSHNRWRADWTVLLTLIGWLALLSGLVSLLTGMFTGPPVFPPGMVARLGLAYGIIWTAVGGFIVYKGFRS